MKVLLDECVDRRLARDIVGHDVRTARQMGWTMIKDRELLALATGRFDVFVTVDRNLSLSAEPSPPADLGLCAARQDEPAFRSQAARPEPAGGY